MSEQEQQIQVKISDKVLRGVYANTMSVMHSPEEFTLDFMNILPPNGIVNARVIVSPAHLKRIVAALQDNISKYEASFGTIKMAEAKAGGPSSSSSGESKRMGFKTE